MAFDIKALKNLNAKRWAAAKLTRRSAFAKTVDRILAARNRYELVQAQTGVHWVFVALAHYRESNLNFATQLAQGDPLNRVSVNVPRGRGPFQTFEAGAYDALVRCDPKAALNPLWKQTEIMPDMLTLLEAYNGLGYARMGVPSAYVWAGTDQYKSGKYIRDHVYDPNTVDTQLGVAGLILCLLEKDPSLFGTKSADAKKPVQKVSVVQAPTPTPEVLTPPVALPKPSEPILNKEGEDITDYLNDLAHDVWEWLRRH